jgi:hypothetical protein
MPDGIVRTFGSMVTVLASLAAALVLVFASSARAESTPIGVLPDGPVSTVTTQCGLLVAVALPRQKPSTGLVWRVARNMDSKILRQIDEIESASSVVVVFRVVGAGSTSIVFALTRGESSPRALRSHTTRVDAY